MINRDLLRFPLFLAPTIKNYHWGKLASESLVAKLSSTNSKLKEEPYAELWFGAHPSSSSEVKLPDGSQHSLAQLIQQNPKELLGDKIALEYSGTLPFLFKILSVAKPLSIQVHPDLPLAAELHRRDPEHYPDTNHKPEICLAQTKVEMLYGFRPRDKLAASLESCPELLKVLEAKIALDSFDTLSVSDFSKLTEKIYRSVLTLSDSHIRDVCLGVYQRLEQSGAQSPEEKWIQSLSATYPDGDVGLLSFYLLNLLELKPGEAIASVPGVPHAYLSGDLVECMANCDNTIRAGLTPKFKDIPTLLDMVDYGFTDTPRAGVSVNGAERIYETGAKEFSIREFNSTEKFSSVLENVGPAILFCLQGEGEVSVATARQKKQMTPGEALFVPASLEKLELSASGQFFLAQTPNSGMAST